MNFNKLIELVEGLNLTYPIGFSDKLFPLNIEYSKELIQIKEKVRNVAKEFKFKYIGRADRSFEYQRKSDGLGFRIGISESKDNMMTIVLIPDKNMAKLFDSREIKITKDSLSLDSLIEDLDSGKLEEVLRKTEINK